MDKYYIILRPAVMKMLDSIYLYVSYRSVDDSIAERLISAIEQAILSLDTMPQRCPEITTGVFANKGYRKMIIKNYLIVYDILEKQRKVVVIFIKNIRMDI